MMVRTLLPFLIFSLFSSFYADSQNGAKELASWVDEMNEASYSMDMANPAKASDTTKRWNVGGETALNFSQVALSNWTGGGQNSISTTGRVGLYANYTQKESSWENSLDIAYGLLRRGETPFVKSDDKMELSSTFGRKAFGNTYYSGMLDFRSQFSPGYTFPEKDSAKVSDLFSPAYLLATLGLDFTLFEGGAIIVSPVSGKMTIVQDQRLADQGAFGVDPAVTDEMGNVIVPGENIRRELGGYVKVKLEKSLMENVKLRTKVGFFSNYLDQPQNVDVNWELLLSMKVNDFITASIATDLIYDDDIMVEVDEDNDGDIDAIGPRTQFKEVLNIGVSYAFDNTPDQ